MGYIKMSAFKRVARLFANYRLVGHDASGNNIQISFQDFWRQLDIESSGGAGQPIFFTGTQLPNENNTGDSLVKGDWTILSPGQTYVNVGGGSDILAPSGRLSFSVYNGNTWEIVDMGELPKNELTNIVNQEENKAITPKGVDDEFSKIRKPTNQLLDKSKFVFGYYLSNGTTGSSTATIRTPKIPIKQGETKLSISDRYSLGAAIENRVFFWDENGLLTGVVPTSTIELKNISIPAGSVEWGMNIVTQSGLSSATDNYYANTIMANYGEDSLPYENYGYNLVGENIESIPFDDSINLIDKKRITYGYWTNEGARSNSTTTISTPKIDIDASKEFLSVNINHALAPTIEYRVLFWDDNDGFISGVSKNESNQGIPIPEEATKAAVNITSVSGGVGDPTDNVYVNTLQMEYGEQSTPYQSFGKKISKEVLPGQASAQTIAVSIKIDTANSFTLTSYHLNGQEVQHTWIKNNKAPQYDDGWRPVDIFHQGRRIVQGSFNWIHMISGENEGDHVGTGHGCETMRRVHFYVDGKEFFPATDVGKTITGTKFHFDFASEIYVSDHAETVANWDGSNVVPRFPLEVSVYHYMIGEMGANSKSKNHNKLVSNRDNLIFARCYLGMHNTYRDFFDRVEISNIENTLNDIQTLTAIEDSTANMIGATYDTADSMRAELACRAISYSDRFGYVMKTEAFASREAERLKTSVLFSSAGKAYFQPVITTEIASQRGLPVDVFNKGDVLEGVVYRELHV